MQIEIFIGKVGMQTQKNKFRFKKKPEIKHFIAPQKYLTQGGMQTPKIYLWI